MGAAASIKQIYEDGILWFKKYFDEDLYTKDFNSMDKDGSGGISYIELEKWIKGKSSTEGGSWSFMISNPMIIKIAHAQAVKHSTIRDETHFVNQKVVGLGDFRNLLIHLFAISILWVHFKNADDWVEGFDFGNMALSLEEFKLACRTVSASHANELLTDEQIEEDFVRLDLNKNNSLAFLEVCEYCCQYINSELGPHKLETLANSVKIRATMNNGTNDFAIDSSLLSGEPYESEKSPPQAVLQDLQYHSSEKLSSQFRPASEKNAKAMDAMAHEIQKNQSVADFVEVKVTTEHQMSQIFNQ